MRRLALAIACALVALPACNDGGGQSSEPVVVRVQAAGGESEIKAIEQMARAFEGDHPDVRVEVIGVAEQGDHMAKLATAFAGGDPPEVFLLNYRRFGQFASKDVIDPPAADAIDKADYYDQPLEAFTFEGRLLCLPQNASSTVLYFNPSLLQRAGVQPPTTAADLRKAAEKLHGAGIQAIGFEHTMRTVAPFVWSLGGEVVDNTDKPTRITLDGPAGRQAMDLLKGLLPYGIDANEEAADPAEERFARGELAMFLDSRRAVPKFRKSEGLVFDVAPLPQAERPATLLASDAYCVSKKGKQRQAAHRFAQFAVGPTGGKVLADAGRTVPSNKALAASPAFLAPGKPPKSSQVWLDVLPTARRLPNVGPWNEAESNASELLEQFFAGKLSGEEAAARIKSESTRILAQRP